jgi:hypothetical protein
VVGGFQLAVIETTLSVETPAVAVPIVAIPGSAVMVTEPAALGPTTDPVIAWTVNV